MRLIHALAVVLAGMSLVGAACAGGQGIALESVHGAVDKGDKETLTIQTRGPAGQFGKKLTLKLTGTSKLTAVALEKRGGKMVPVQRDVEAQDLESGQAIAVIHSGGADPVLLAGVVQRGGKK